MAYCTLSHYSFYHFIIFLMTFFSYACLHATRKSFSNVKPTILNEWTGSLNESKPLVFPNATWNKRHLFQTEEDGETFLGTLDMTFMFSYSIGLFISGHVGERLNHRWVLSSGMMASAIVVVIFGVVTEWLHFYNKYFYIGFWILNGLCQSTGWPTAVAIMGNWFGENKGLIFGIWSACASVGNVIGALLCSFVINYGYEYGFLVPASMLFSGGLLVGASIINHPNEIGHRHYYESGDGEEAESLLTDENDIPGDSTINEALSEHSEVQQAKPIGFIKALLIPGVIPYALAYAALKLVNYSFFFWLPLYLYENYNWSNEFADQVSSYYDFGGIVGGILLGTLTDFMWARSPATIGSLLISVPCLYLYAHSPNNEKWNSFLMWLTGFFIGGPANVISATVMADLGAHKDITGNKDAFAVVTGIVDGTGSFGAAIGQILVPLIHENMNWDWTFYFFMLLDLLTSICLIPVLVKDIRKKCFPPTTVEDES